MGTGALVATAFAHPLAPFPVKLVTQASPWYVGLLIPAALLGGLVWSGSSLYSSGLDLDAIVPRLGRPGATTIVSVASVGLVLIGSLAWNAAAAFSALVVILLAATAPWAAVIGVGYLRRHGRYLKDDLQVFNRRQTGGDYWYTAGWNIPAVIAWAAGCVFGLLSVNTTPYTGPVVHLVGGVDLSFAGSFIIAAVLYPVLEKDRACGHRVCRPRSRPYGHDGSSSSSPAGRREPRGAAPHRGRDMALPVRAAGRRLGHLPAPPGRRRAYPGGRHQVR